MILVIVILVQVLGRYMIIGNLDGCKDSSTLNDLLSGSRQWSLPE